MKFPKAVPGYMVWAMHRTRGAVLRAVDTTLAMAKAHEQAVLREQNTERAYIETTRLNHLYFGLYEHGLPDPRSIKAALAKARRKARAAKERDKGAEK